MILDAFRIHATVDLDIKYHFAHEHLMFVEKGKIHRVFSNIVGNAIEAIKKYGGKTLWFSSKEIIENGTLIAEFSIGNDGPGIPEEYLSQLFESFFSKKEGGTGLGLAIAKKVTEDHGGKIRCESSANSNRVEFFFTLPLSDMLCGEYKKLPASSAEIRSLYIEQEKQSEGARLIVEDPREKALEEKIVATVKALDRKIILALVDDDFVYRSGVDDLVQESEALAQSVELHQFSNGADLLNSGNIFDGYILDVDMGVGAINGYEVAKTIRERGFKGGISIHSNRVLSEDIEYSLKAGADQCLPKPMSQAHLLGFIAYLVVDRLQISGAIPAAATKIQTTALTIKVKIVVLEDSSIFRLDWIHTLQESGAEAYGFKKPEDFYAKIQAEPTFLDDITAIVTDNNFQDAGSSISGLEFGAEMKRRGCKTPLYLASNGEFSQPELAGRIDYVIGKDAMPWKEICRVRKIV